MNLITEDWNSSSNSLIVCYIIFSMLSMHALNFKKIKEEDTLSLQSSSQNRLISTNRNDSQFSLGLTNSLSFEKRMNEFGELCYKGKLGIKFFAFFTASTGIIVSLSFLSNLLKFQKQKS